jgi:alpha-mannosidase
VGLLLWGIGNHGGGPSREDLSEIRRLMGETGEWDIRHGIPEDYFDSTADESKELPRRTADLNPWAVGCYTTMSLLKQRHRRLENRYYMTEKMAAHAALAGLVSYPKAELQQACEDLLFAEFHDILPGSSIPEVESYALQRMDHGLEILDRIRTAAFFALLRGQPAAPEEEFPVFVYNPHAFPVHETMVVEFQPAEPIHERDVVRLPLMENSSGEEIPCQLEQESSNIADDWRKRVAFEAHLEPGRMNRFICRLERKNLGSGPPLTDKDTWLFSLGKAEAVVNPETGFLDAYRAGDLDFLEPNAFRLLVMEDDADPWGMKVKGFRKEVGEFSLLDEESCARLAGVTSRRLKPVRIIEDGPVRTLVETLLGFNRSEACLRYIFPKNRNEIGLEIRIFWNEKDRMLKLSVPSTFRKGFCLGEVAYGVEEFTRSGEELIAQKWVAVLSRDRSGALYVINDGTYGFDFSGGELRPSLLRSAAYAAHPVGEGIPLVPQDRFTARIDQGERIFRFWIRGIKAKEGLRSIGRAAQVKNEKPMILCCSPPGTGEDPRTFIKLSDETIQVTALKMAEEGERLIIRLFEPTGKPGKTEVSLPLLGIRFTVSLGKFEIKTLSVDIKSGKVFEMDLMENRLE